MNFYVVPQTCALCGRLIVGESTLVCERATPKPAPPEWGIASYTLTYTTTWCASCAAILPPLPYDPSEPGYAD